MSSITIIATCTAGLEVVVKRELQAKGFKDFKVETGRIAFCGQQEDIPICNLWLRSADRVLLQLNRFFAPSFDDLYEGIRRLPWGEILPKNASFPIHVKTSRSKLKSAPSCQSVAKKAVVDALTKTYRQKWFDENGPLFPIIISIERDEAVIAIDTTGDGLHKRGYRKKSVEAPLQETLACGMVQLSFWKGNRLLLDPFCGSGTIPIEAAMIYHNIAPGLKRSFLGEQWPLLSPSYWKKAREEAKDLIQRASSPDIVGADISHKTIEKASFHAREASVHTSITFKTRPFSKLSFKEEHGALITNPPYGERQQEREEVEEIYREMGHALRPLKTWSFYILSSNRGFESLFGRKATKRRKLYNGGIECQFYQYYGPRVRGKEHA